MTYIDIIRSAGSAKDAAAAAYVEAEAEFEAIRNEAIAAGVISGGMDAESAGKLIDLVKRYGPRVAAIFGGPAAATAVTAWVAEDGAFSGLTGVFQALLGVLGVG